MRPGLLRRVWLAYPVGYAEVLVGACIGMTARGTFWSEANLSGDRALPAVLAGLALVLLGCLAVTVLYLRSLHRRMAQVMQHHWIAEIKRINRRAVAERAPEDDGFNERDPDWWRK